MFVVALLVLGMVSNTLAISSGKVSLCDVPPDVYGCEEWEKDAEGKDNRKKCKDDGRIMAWATAPVTNEETFWLFAGNKEDEDAGISTYTPGQRMQLNLRVRKYDQQYRGLIMYAVDDKGNKVGDFDFVGRPEIFHGHCPQSVVHATGELKPYLTSWGFTAPKAGTGKIKFIALVKTGVANVGDFWFTNALELTEGAAAPAGDNIRWVRSKKADMNCNDVCKEECATLTCNAGALTQIDSPDAINTKIAAVTQCTLPHLARCAGGLGPTSSVDNMCYYHSPAVCRDLGLDVAPPTCGGRSADERVGFRICPCSGTCTKPTTTRTTTARITRAPATTTVRQTTVAPPTNAGDPPLPPPPGPCEGPNAGGPGCKCPDGVCQGGLACTTASDGTGLCIAVSNACASGAKLGCECASTAECGSAVVAGINQALVCSADGRCLVEKRFDCDAQLGTAGCWCTEERSCDPGLECSAENNNCVVASAVGADCTPGKASCPCIDGNECEPGLRCASFGSDSNSCVIAEASAVVDPETGSDSAATLTLATAAIVAAVVNM